MQVGELNLVEKHIINSKELYDKTHIAKNLYNASLYTIRQSFYNKENSKMIFFNELDKIMNNQENYKLLPATASQQILRRLDKNFKSYFKSIKDWKKNPSKYNGMPKLPKYLKKDGHLTISIPGQSFRTLKNGITIPKTKINIKTNVKKENLKEVRIVPISKNKVKVEIVYSIKINDLKLNKENSIGIDIGVNNLMAITSNQTNPLCRLINGRPLKSINQYYNKNVAEIKSDLKIKNDKNWSNKLQTLSEKRNNKIQDYLHKSSKKVIDFCIEHNIGYIIIGYNSEWKQDCNMGKINNQNFVQIPFLKLINMIKYKSKLVGIKVDMPKESYTSKIDHLSNEEMKHHDVYLVKRIKRGLFKSSTNKLINSDINGSIGMLRKKNAVSKEWLNIQGNRGCVCQPVKITIK